MLDIRVGKTVADRGCESLQIFSRKIKGWNYFVIDDVVHKIPNDVIFHKVHNNVVACQISGQNSRRVGTVQNAYFPFLVRADIVSPYDVSVGFMYGEYISPFFPAFDDPEVEQFAGVDQVVLIAQLFFELSRLIPGISGNDPVNQGAGEMVGLLDPENESFSQLPFPCIFENDPL